MAIKSCKKELNLLEENIRTPSAIFQLENIFYISIVLPLIVMGYEIKSIIEGITVKQKNIIFENN